MGLKQDYMNNSEPLKNKKASKSKSKQTKNGNELKTHSTYPPTQMAPCPHKLINLDWQIVGLHP